MLLLLGCGTSSGPKMQTGIPPLPMLGPVTGMFDGDLGDPFLLTTGDDPSYTVFGTDDAPSRIPTATSSDLVHWTPGPDAFPPATAVVGA